MDVLKLTDAQQSIFDSIVYNIKNGNGRYDCVIQGYAGTGKRKYEKYFLPDRYERLLVFHE